MKLNYFTNDKYKILKHLYKNSYLEDKKILYRGNQQDIANNVNFTKGKVNMLMKELYKNKFIILLNKRMGLYEITDKTIKVIRLFEDTEV